MKSSAPSFKKSAALFFTSIAGTIIVIIASGALNEVNAQVNKDNTKNTTINNITPAAGIDSLKTARIHSTPIINNLDAPPAGTGHAMNEGTNSSTNTAITTGSEAAIPVIYNIVGVPPNKSDPDYFAKYQIFVKNNPDYFAISPTNKDFVITPADSNKVVAPATENKISK